MSLFKTNWDLDPPGPPTTSGITHSRSTSGPPWAPTQVLTKLKSLH